MPFEGVPDNAAEQTEQDLDAARQLIEKNPVLRDNSRVQFLAENDFVTEDGRQLDAGNFLASMLKYLESQSGESQSGAVDAEQLDAAISENMVTHSLPPTIESQSENRPQ